MATLHLGVIEMPYTHSKAAITTGAVAEILEAKYHVFEHFWNMRQAEIVHALEESVAGATESMLLGAPPKNDIYGAGTSEIEIAFQNFIDSKAMDALGYPGIPTMASLLGVSHRFKNRKGVPGRPSFQDTGLYETSMRAWVD